MMLSNEEHNQIAAATVTAMTSQLSSLSQPAAYGKKLTVKDTNQHRASDVSTGVYEEVTIIADPSNSGTIYIGTVDSAVVPLAASGSFTFKKKDISQIGYYGDTVNDILYVLA